VYGSHHDSKVAYRARTVSSVARTALRPASVHLPQAADRVGHEVDDQLGERGVENIGVERQLLGGRLPDVGRGQPLPHRGHERGRRLDRADRVRPGPAGELGRQRPGPAAHVQQPLAPVHAGQVGELARERPGVLPDESLICVRADVEAHAGQLTGLGTRCRERDNAIVGDATGSHAQL
jgi:hypothetical protein